MFTYVYSIRSSNDSTYYVVVRCLKFEQCCSNVVLQTVNSYDMYWNKVYKYYTYYYTNCIRNKNFTLIIIFIVIQNNRNSFLM